MTAYTGERVWGRQADPDATHTGAKGGGYTTNEIDRQCDRIVQRVTGDTAGRLSLTCGLDGCQTVFEGATPDVLAARDEHRKHAHPQHKSAARRHGKYRAPDWKEAEARKNGNTASVEAKKLGRPPVHTRETAEAALTALAATLGRTPTYSEAMACPAVPSDEALTRLYGPGAFGKALAACGMTPRRAGRPRKQAA